MKEKAKNNKKKKLLTVVLVFAVVLAVTATTWCTQSYKSPKATPSPDATFKLPDEPKPITCTEDTGHFKTGCKLLLHYDADNDGKISDDEWGHALNDGMDEKITDQEFNMVHRAYNAGSINELCPGCYSP